VSTRDRAAPEGNPAAPPSGTPLIPFADLADPGSRGFSFRDGLYVFHGFVVRRGEAVFGWVDFCPHSGSPMAMVDHRYLTTDGRILCGVHGALFAPQDGRCLAGPAVEPLIPWPVQIDAAGMVRVA
jgi:nitrite reductase/ring-hydroxylating ferredoxin subunit